MPIPESIEEQSSVVLSIKTIQEDAQRFTRLYKGKLAALEELKKFLLNQAFNGEL